MITSEVLGSMHAGTSRGSKFTGRIAAARINHPQFVDQSAVLHEFAADRVDDACDGGGLVESRDAHSDAKAIFSASERLRIREFQVVETAAGSVRHQIISRLTW